MHLEQKIEVAKKRERMIEVNKKNLKIQKNLHIMKIKEDFQDLKIRLITRTYHKITKE
jgi:hypothetical protein